MQRTFGIREGECLRDSSPMSLNMSQRLLAESGATSVFARFVFTNILPHKPGKLKGGRNPADPAGRP